MCSRRLRTAYSNMHRTSCLPPVRGWARLATRCQIYFDFSGYSDMAIGLGKMFGFEFLENFNYPYISKSVTEFWRRWHISLSTWFRDYVYIPLGGNRCPPARHIFNLLAVWTLTGFWHGANWTFMAWGLYYWRAAHSGKEIPRRMDYAPAVRAAAPLRAVFHRHRLGVLPQRFDGTGGAVPRQHVHFDGAAQSVRNRISAAVLAVPAVRCCTVRAGVPASQAPPVYGVYWNSRCWLSCSRCA